MVLNTRSIFDSRFTRRMGEVANRRMTSRVLIRRGLRAVDPAMAEPVWDYDLGAYTGNSPYLVLAHNVPAAIVPNIDWRARGYSFAGETTVFQAVGISIPLLTFEWEADVPLEDRAFLDEDQVVIESSFFPGLEAMERYVFVVRNPITSSTDGWLDLLCDVNLKGGIARGNPV